MYLGNLGTVEFNLELPVTGRNGSSIQWHSGNLNFMDHSGKVSRPSYGRGNREVELTASFRYGEYEEQKVYLVTILEENNKIEVDKIFPVRRSAKTGEQLCLPGAVAVLTSDGRLIAHFVEWENGPMQSWAETGHYLSSLALCYNVTGDENIRNKAVYMVDSLKECQDAFAGQEGYHRGFLSAYSEAQFDRSV